MIEMRLLNCILACLLLLSEVARSQGVTSVIINWNGAQAWGCCDLCGSDYWCVNNPGGCGTANPTDQQSFFDPIPAGNKIDQVSVTYYGASCNATSVVSYINSISLGNSSVNYNCTCGACDTYSSIVPFVTDCGVSLDYNYGGWNIFTVAPDSDFCIGRAEIVIAYSPFTTDTLLPVQPGPINGIFQMCGSDTIIYSIDSVAGAISYLWEIPLSWTLLAGQGTTSITVITAQGFEMLCVSAWDSCGSGPARCDTVIISSVPAQPIGMTGPDKVCAFDQATYVVFTGAGIDSLIWSVPADANIIMGVGNDTALISFGTTSSMISVSQVNSCGTGPPMFYQVSVINLATSVSQSDISCFGECDGTITITPSGGIWPYTYLWSPPVGGTGDPAVTGLCADKYFCTVTDATGCIDGDSFLLTEPDSLMLQSPPDDTICAGQSVILTVSSVGGLPPYSYYWAPGSGLNTTTGSTVMASPAVTTSYTILLSDGNTCYQTGIVTVTVDSCSGIPFVESPPYGWSLYPNPAGDMIIVELFQQRMEGIEIILTDLLGKELLCFAVEGKSTPIKEKFDISFLPQGVYLFRIETLGYSSLIKIVKTKYNNLLNLH